MIKNLIILILSLFLTGSIYSQSSYFIKNYDIYGNPDISTNILILDSTFLISGSVQDANNVRRLMIMELSKSGEIIRKKEYGSYSEYYYLPSPKNIVKVYDGYLIAGTIQDSFSYKGFLMKMDNNLDSVWTQYFYPINYGSVGIFCIEKTPENEFIIGGYIDTVKTVATKDIFLAKLDSLGNFKWINIYGTNDLDLVISLSISVDNFYYIGGQKRVSGIYKPFVMKLDTAGNEIWNKTFGNNIGNSSGAYLTATSDTSIILCSSNFNYESNGFKKYDPIITKLDTAGAIIWTKKYLHAQSFLTFTRIIELKDGNLLAAGGNPLASHGYDNGGWLLKISKNNGDSIWSRTYSPVFDFLSSSMIYDITEDDEGNIYAAGDVGPRTSYCKDSSGNRSQDFLGIRTDSMGCIIPGCDTLCGNVKPDFTYIQDSAYQVTFTYSGTANANFWYWDFGYHYGYDPILALCETKPAVTTTYPGPGQYLVTLTAQDPCGNYDTIQKWITILPVGISEKVPKQDLLKLYPNPANEQLTVEIQEQQLQNGLQLDVFDITGRRNISIYVTEAKTTIDISDLKPGVYFLVLRDDKGVLERKSFVVGK